MPKDDSVSDRKSLVPTIGLAIGMLIGGLIAAAVGAIVGSETVVVALYVVGTVGGAVCGAVIAAKWELRCQRRAAGGPGSDPNDQNEPHCPEAEGQ